MYKIEQKQYGYYLTFSDTISPDEMMDWLAESKEMLKTSPDKFGVLVDMRFLVPLSDEARYFMADGQMYYKHNGMERSAVVVSNNFTLIQFKRIAKETGIFSWERYIDSSKTPNWEEVCLDWILKGIDPGD